MSNHSQAELVSATPWEVSFTQLQTVYLGKSYIDSLRREIERRTPDRVFLVVSGTLNRETDKVSRIIEMLDSRFAGLHDKITPNAPREDILAAAELAKQAGVDLIVSMGGGSVTDAAKIVPLCLKHNITSPDEFEPFRFVIDVEKGVVVNPEFAGPDIPVISIPTTLSGGDYYSLAGATDTKNKLKQPYEKPSMAPVAVILDPQVTLHTDEWLWLSTGVRALDHAMESLGALNSNDYFDGMAINAIRLLAEGLLRVKENPNDLAARLKCQIGAWNSMIPIVAGLPMGASHAIGHALGGTFNVPHGHTSCVMAPYVLAYNQSVNGERQRLISKAFDQADRPASVIADEYISNLGMPRTLREAGIQRQDLPALAEATMQDFWARTNPRTINSTDDIMEILDSAFSG